MSAICAIARVHFPGCLCSESLYMRRALQLLYTAMANSVEVTVVTSSAMLASKLLLM